MKEKILSIANDLKEGFITAKEAKMLLLDLFDVGINIEIVCDHKYKDNVCDWRGVRKCLICGKSENGNS